LPNVWLQSRQKNDHLLFAMISMLDHRVYLAFGNHHSAAKREDIKMTGSEKMKRRLRLLVAIASHGSKNLEFLKKLIQRYQGMSMNVDVVVFSEAHKDLPLNVKVIVGLPSPNPWSLPFAHKTYFAQNCDRYDLFIYSEDDMEVAEENIQAFLRITPQLKPDEIAGYLRYERDLSGDRSLPDAHGAFHWKAESVRRRGIETIAEFTNEHAGFYILTQSQLQQAVVSGGFLTEPYEGRYGLPETAATDPYTRCGFRKVICISALEDFLIHHMPNRYVGQLGTPLSAFKEQIHTLMEICDDNHPSGSLCEVESKLRCSRWSKPYDEKPSEELLKMVPGSVKTILSIGCGRGAIETSLKQRGVTVTAIPLDSVIGAAAARLGIEVVYGTWDEYLTILDGRKFDCVLMPNLLHLLPNPKTVLEQCSRFVREGGTFVISGPNFDCLSVLIKRTFGTGDYGKLRCFGESGISVCGPRTFKKDIEQQGLRVEATKWIHQASPRRNLGGIWSRLGSLTAKDWIIRARRKLLN
jgi:SAM-dependent methyltransferase